MPEPVYCGDCGDKLQVKNGFHYCPSCQAKTRLKYVGTVHGRMSGAKPNQQNHPKTLSQFDGGGAQGACHKCGCAFGECECGKDK